MQSKKHGFQDIKTQALFEVFFCCHLPLIPKYYHTSSMYTVPREPGASAPPVKTGDTQISFHLHTDVGFRRQSHSKEPALR